MPASRQANLASPYLTLSAHPTIGAVLLDSRPGWVWNAEGNRILWANAAGLAFFGEDSMEALLNRSFGDVHPARRHLARLARNARPDTPTLDMLRFFLGLSFVTLSCLCKKLQVEGETVLLVLSSEPLDAIKVPGQKGFDGVISDPKTALLASLTSAGDLHAALLDEGGKIIASSAEFVPFGKNAMALGKLLAKLNESQRFAEGSLPFFDSQTEAAVAHISDEFAERYLLLVQNPESKTSAAPSELTSPFAELEDENQAEQEKEFAAAEADVFEDQFGLNELADIEDHLIKGPDRLKDADLQPFTSDVGQLYSSTSYPDPVIGHDLAKSIKARDGQGHNDSNVFQLPLVRRSEPGTLSRASGEAIQPPDNGGANHFVWESDAVGRFKHVSEELAKAVGRNNASIDGLTWPEVAKRFAMDSAGDVASGFESRDTWASLDVWWPVEGKPYSIAVELTGLPVYGHLHGFQGYRGFGLCHPNKRMPINEETPAESNKQELNATGGNQEQFCQLEELISEDLLKAAQNAVETTTELISPVAASDGGHVELLTDETNGVTAVSDDSKKGPEDQSYDNNNQNELDPIAPEASEEDNAFEQASNQTYARVGSLLSGRAEGVREVADASPAGSGGENSTTRSALSAGEKTAFQEIADALSDSSFESRLPEEDLDDDYEEPTFFADADLEEDEEEHAASLQSASAPASALPTEQAIEQTDGLPLSDVRQNDGTQPAASGDASKPQTDEPSEKPVPAMKRRPLAALIKKSLTDEQPVLPWHSSHSSLGDMLAARERKDHAHKSAASKALHDIFSIDPKLKALHEKAAPSQLAEPSDEAIEPPRDAATELPLQEAAGSDLAPPASSTEEVSPESETAVLEPTSGIDASQFDEAVSTLTHFVISASEEGNDDQAIPPALPSLADDVESPADLGADVMEPPAKEASSESTAALAAATVAGVAALGGRALWDKADKKSPLIDLLNKLPTALVVSAKSEILFASKPALTLLKYETSEALQSMGGMEGLFAGRPGDWLTKTNGRTTLRTADGSPVSVQANISSINWGETPAAMLCFEETPVEPPSIGVSEEDEKIAELEAILDTATDGVLVLDRDGRILRMNHSAEALFEVDRHKVAGEPFISLLAQESHKDALSYLERLRNDGLASVLNGGQDVIGKLRSGGLVPLVMTMGRVSIPGTNRFCAVLRDVTEWKRTPGRAAGPEAASRRRQQEKI